MIEKCPACGRRPDSSPVCGRCGAALETLQRAATAAAGRESRGLALLRHGDVEKAAVELSAAVRLSRSPERLKAAAVAAACAGQRRAALKTILVHRKLQAKQ